MKLPDFVKTLITLIVAIPSLASTYFMYEDREREKADKLAKADTIQLFIQKQNEQNKKLADFFAALDSAEKLQSIADTTGN